MIYPSKIGQNSPFKAYMRPHPPISTITEAILRTVCVPMALYIHMLIKVIGMNVAVKMMPHMLTCKIETLYASAKALLAGARHKLNALTIIMQLIKKKMIGHRRNVVLGTKRTLPD